MKCPEYKEIGRHGHGNEIGLLAQDTKGRVDGTDTMYFIHKHEVPQDRFKDVSCRKINCHYREGKAEPNQVRLTAGGDRINFPGDIGTPTADLLTVKLLINNVLSTPWAEWFTMDINTSI